MWNAIQWERQFSNQIFLGASGFVNGAEYARFNSPRGVAVDIVRIGRWKIYVDEALPRTHIQLSFWDGRLRAEYESQILTEYRCKWGKKSARPAAISQPIHHNHPFQSRQMTLYIVTFIGAIPMKRMTAIAPITANRFPRHRACL